MSRRALPALLLIALLAITVRPLEAWDWLWTHQFTSTVAIGAYGGAADGSGTYAAGLYFGTLAGTPAIGGYDAFVRKIDQSGEEMWTRQIGTASFDNASGVAADADGAYTAGITCGALPGFVRLGGCDAWAAKFNPD